MEHADGVWHHPTYKFSWTKHHLPRSHTDPLRYEYDKLGSEALERLQEIKARISSGNDGETASKDLYVLLREYRQSDPVLEKFWTEVTFVPNWVDWAQIERAQAFFVSGTILLLS